MARAKAKAAAEAKAKAEEEERQRIVAERRAASAAYRRAKAQYLLGDLDKRMAAWRAIEPRRTRYGDDARVPAPLRPGARGGARRGGRRGAGRRRRVARLDRRGGAARGAPPGARRRPGNGGPRRRRRPRRRGRARTPDALRDSRVPSCPATSTSSARARPTTASRDLARRGPEVARARRGRGGARRARARRRVLRARPRPSPTCRRCGGPRRTPSASPRTTATTTSRCCSRPGASTCCCGPRAGAAVRRRRVRPRRVGPARAARADGVRPGGLRPRARRGGLAANVLQKKFWRGRVWWPPFWARVKAHRIAVAEALVAPTAGATTTRARTCRHYYPKKWFCLLLYEDHVVAVAQRFIRRVLDYRTKVLLDARRHLRTVNAALSAFTRAPCDGAARAPLPRGRARSADARGPRYCRRRRPHRRGGRCVSSCSSAWRGAARPRPASRSSRTSGRRRVRPRDAPRRAAARGRRSRWRGAGGSRRAARRRRASRRGRGASTRARPRSASPRSASSTRRASCRAPRASSPRAAGHDARGEAFDGRIVARALQRACRPASFLIDRPCFQRWFSLIRPIDDGSPARRAQAPPAPGGARRLRPCSHRRGGAPRGPEGRAPGPGPRERGRDVRREAAVLAHRRRHAVLRRRRPRRAAGRGPAADDGDGRAARRGGAPRRGAAADAGAGQRPTTAARPVWWRRASGARPSRGGRALAALPDAAKEGGHPLAGAAAALFALHLRAWNCALRTVVVVAAPVDTDLAAALGGCRTLRELCLVDGRLGPEALAALWGAVRAAGLRLEAVRVDDAHHHRRLAPGAARAARYGDVGRAVGACVGDYVFRQVGRLRAVALVRGGLGDAAVEWIGRARSRPATSSSCFWTTTASATAAPRRWPAASPPTEPAGAGARRQLRHERRVGGAPGRAADAPGRRRRRRGPASTSRATTPTTGSRPGSANMRPCWRGTRPSGGWRSRATRGVRTPLARVYAARDAAAAAAREGAVRARTTPPRNRLATVVERRRPPKAARRRAVPPHARVDEADARVGSLTNVVCCFNGCGLFPGLRLSRNPVCYTTPPIYFRRRALW